MAGYYRVKEMELIQGTPECLRWFKSRAPNQEFRAALFIYRHHATGNFMLGRWITDRGVFAPLLQIGPDLRSDFNEKVRDEYRALCRPGLTAAAAGRQAESNQREQDNRLAEGTIERRVRILRDELRIKGVPETGAALLPDSILGS